MTKLTLRVFTFGPAWGLPTAGPFGLKLAGCLRMLRVPYARAYENDNRKVYCELVRPSGEDPVASSPVLAQFGVLAVELSGSGEASDGGGAMTFATDAAARDRTSAQGRDQQQTSVHGRAEEHSPCQPRMSMIGV